MFSAVADSLASLLFPSYCELCHHLIRRATGSTLCDSCWNQIQPWMGTVCARCGEPLISPQVPADWECGRCRRADTLFDFCRSFGIYDGTLRESIHLFKYGHRTRLGKRFSDLLMVLWNRWPQLADADLVLPMPLHRRRKRERGFNQSEILAQGFARQVGKPYEPRLFIRTLPTPSQTGLSRRQRRLNVAGAFEVRHPARLEGKVCLLIDDVLTTGATLNEASTVLKRGGAQKVLVLTLARVSPLAALGSERHSLEQDIL
ncbi:MAG: ComF family protein [Acidobacteriia bacterium]|nr:ComF family protein [Terriglobia bacterium]